MGATLEDILNSHRTGRAIVMGILNVTPDSFSDGGEFFDTERAVAQGLTMVAEGADIVDVGAESTRPGSDRVSGDEQVDRLREVLPRVVDLGVPVSIDTTRSEVAAFALDAGAAIINDVSAGRDDPEMLPLAGSRGASVVLMHMLGAPKTMQLDPHYEDVVAEVRGFLSERLTAAASAGVPETRCIVDPGIGFGKRLEHNLALLNGVGELLKLGRAVLIGASRKRFIRELTAQVDPTHRLGGTIAASIVAWSCGATIFRVHEVGPMVAALKVAAALSPTPHRRSFQ